MLKHAALPSSAISLPHRLSDLRTETKVVETVIQLFQELTLATALSPLQKSASSRQIATNVYKLYPQNKKLQDLVERCQGNLRNNTPNNFSGLDLSGMDFGGCSISGMHFLKCNLKGANFGQCTCVGTPPDLREARLDTMSYNTLYRLGIRNFKNILFESKVPEVTTISIQGADLANADMTVRFCAHVDASEANLSNTRFSQQDWAFHSQDKAPWEPYSYPLFKGGITFSNTICSIRTILNLIHAGVVDLNGVILGPMQGTELTKKDYLILYEQGFRKFQGVKMTGDMRGVPVQGCNFDGANFTSTRWNATFDASVSFKSVTWDSADLKAAKFEARHDDSTQGTFEGTKLSAKSLAGLYNYGERNFSRATLSDKDLTAFRFQGTRFDGCDLRDVRFSPLCRQLTLCEALVDIKTLQSLANRDLNTNFLTELIGRETHNLSRLKIDQPTLEALLRHGIKDLSECRLNLSQINFSGIDLRGVKLDACELSVESIATIDTPRIFGQILMDTIVERDFGYFRDHPDARKKCAKLEFFSSAWDRAVKINILGLLTTLDKRIDNFTYELPLDGDIVPDYVTSSLASHSTSAENMTSTERLAGSIKEKLANYRHLELGHRIDGYLKSLFSGEREPEEIPMRHLEYELRLITSTQPQRPQQALENQLKLKALQQATETYPLCVIEKLRADLKGSVEESLTMDLLDPISTVAFKGLRSKELNVREAAQELLDDLNRKPPCQALSAQMAAGSLFFFSHSDHTLVYAVTPQYLEAALDPNPTVAPTWGNIFIWCKAVESHTYESQMIGSTGLKLDGILGGNPIVGQRYLADHPSSCIHDLFMQVAAGATTFKDQFSAVFTCPPGDFSKTLRLNVTQDAALWKLFSKPNPDASAPDDNIARFLELALAEKPLNIVDSHYLLYLSWVATQLSSNKFLGESSTSVISLRSLALKLIEEAVERDRTNPTPIAQKFSDNFLEGLKGDNCTAVIAGDMQAFIKRESIFRRTYLQLTPIAWR